MATVYRFLPWTRRGLAAALPGGADGGDLPQRPEVAVTVVVAGAGPAESKALLHGPGDVIGLDPAQVVRTYPRPYTTDAEPNYLAAVDLDAPELPWLFTPRGVPTSGHLPPWIVLVVVEDRAGVSVSVPAGAPLPQLRIESGAGAELPDLADSWAWAHVQLVEPSGGAGAVATALSTQPDRNVGRLVCPRRLAPNRRWIAALVPAFDVGRVRGLGGAPAADAPVKAAWSPGQSSVTLPAYFHWEFQTGPEGDFESLAQRLKPHKAATTVGLVPMHIGEGAPPLRVPVGQARVIDMDGALRAPVQSDGRIDQVPDALRDGLEEVTRTLADAADGVLDGQSLQDASRQPVGPPVYGSSHVRRWRVLDRQQDQDAEWFRELNLDPRARVAAGLGAECVRENQEDIVNAAWRQVGDVMAAEAALQRAALSELASRSFYRRSVVPMGDDRLLALVGPLAARTPLDGLSLTATIARTSLPDAVIDPGLRRALAPAGRGVARSARRMGVGAGQVRPGLVGALAAGRSDLDATRFARPVLSGVMAEALRGTDLSALGLPLEVGAETVKRLATSAKALVDNPVEDSARFTLRADVRTVGLLGQAHVEAARGLALKAQGTVSAAVAVGSHTDVTTVASVASGALLDGLVIAAAAAMTEAPAGGQGVGLLVEGPTFAAGSSVLDSRTPSVEVGILDLDARNTLVVRTRAGRPNVPVAVLDGNLAGVDLGGVLTRLPVDVVRRPDPAVAVGRGALPVLRDGARPAGLSSARGLSPVLRADLARGTDVARDPVRIDRGAGIGVGPVVVADPGVSGTVRPVAEGERSGVTVPPLIRDGAVIARFESALALQREVTFISTPAPIATLVPYDLAVATTAVKVHVDPRVAQPLRRDAMVSFAGSAIGALRAVNGPFVVDGWWATRGLDRIMAYPTFPMAASDYLATYDQSRFCPGIDTIPTDSVTLLETNPRFIAAYMVGLNHETNRELLWRGYPTDSRGTPFRRFWRRLDGKDDIPPIHGWRTGTLAEQTTDPKGSLVLLVRGDLLRRYPNTIVVAMPARGAREPDHDKAITPIFHGQFAPDVSFFGFALIDTDLEQGEGWFFALMEPVTEPRFGLDETKGGPSGGGAAGASDALAWSDTGVEPAAHLGVADFGGLALNPAAIGADDVAATLFQKPFALYVHAKYLVNPLPVQR